jgi:hypothetical protein
VPQCWACQRVAEPSGTRPQVRPLRRAHGRARPPRGDLRKPVVWSPASGRAAGQWTRRHDEEMLALNEISRLTEQRGEEPMCTGVVEWQWVAFSRCLVESRNPLQLSDRLAHFILVLAPKCSTASRRRFWISLMLSLIGAHPSLAGSALDAPESRVKSSRTFSISFFRRGSCATGVAAKRPRR